MITDEIKKYQEEIISAIDNFDLYADLIVDENRIEIPLNIDTLEFSKKQYEAWEETVLNYDKDYDKFNVHLMNDGSGYEYWTVKQEETNYCYVIVEIEEINDKNVQNIIEAIQAAFDYYNEKIEKIKGMNESLAASLNKLISEALDGTDSETEDDEEDYLDITEEAKALAKFLEIPETDVEDVESDDYYDYLYKVEAKKDGKKHIYYVSSDEYDIKRGVEDSLESLFDGLTVPEFCEKVIPYLSGNVDDYLKPYGTTNDEEDSMSFEDRIDYGEYDGVFGRDFHGYVDYDKMADDVISMYGAGHELSPYDGETNEVELDGTTYFLFKQGEETILTEDVTTLCDKIDKADAELKEIVKTLTEDNKKDIVFKNEWSIIDDPYSSELQCLSDDEFKLILFYLVSKNCYRARLTSLNNEKFPLFDSRRVEFDSGDYKTWEETLAQLQKFANESFNINLIIKNKPNKDIIDKLVKTVTDKYHQSVKADFDKIPKNTKNQMVIEFSIENPKWYEKTKLYFELLIIKEQDSTYSWKETYNSNEGHKFKTAVEAYEDAVEFNEYPLKDLEDFEIDKTANDVAKYFNENINEDLLDDVNNIEKFYALDLNDPESLDNIWTLREFTDNMDSKDGKTLCKYTKIGLIDTINSEIEDINDSHYDPVTGEETTEETIDRDITNKDLFGYLEYLPTGAELVSIENYDINKLYDEPNQPKE